MLYERVYGTRLPEQYAMALEKFAQENEIGEAAVLRLAVKRFFSTPAPESQGPDLHNPVEPLQLADTVEE